MFEAFQDAVFNQVAKEIKHRFPDDSLTLTYATEQIIEDFTELSKRHKLVWDPWLKSQPFFSSDHKHHIKLAVYYRKVPVGYAFGNFSEDRCAVEICWMEKRIDADPDLDKQMLPIALSAYSAYALLLRARGYVVDKIAMVSPRDVVIPYYKAHTNFRYISDYDRGACAMVLDIV